MKVLVLGSMGMAGHVIALYFKEKKYDVSGYARRHSPFYENIIGDVFELEKLKSILNTGQYDLVINCIGLLNQTAEDNPSIAVYVNSFLPHFLADTLKEKKTKFIHMSTDCVFSGNTGPYYENSFKDGGTLYDRTKALGEIEYGKNLTFRNSIIGPDINVNGIGLFNWFMKQKGYINGYTRAIWTGVTTIVLAEAMEKAYQQNLTGLYNLVNNESISKYNLLILFSKYFNGNPINIIPVDNVNIDKTLICSRKDFSFKVPSYEEQVCQMKQWIDSHKELYPHYK